MPLIEGVSWGWADVAEDDLTLEWSATAIELSVRAPTGDADDRYILALRRLNADITACKVVKKKKRLVLTAKKKRSGMWGSLQKSV